MEEPAGECSCVGGDSDIGHAIFFYSSQDADEFSFHVGGGSAGEVSKRSGDGLNQKKRLEIIRDFCRDCDVQFLRIYLVHGKNWHYTFRPTSYVALTEVMVVLIRCLERRSILKCFVVDSKYEFYSQWWIQAVADMVKANSSLIHFKMTAYCEIGENISPLVEALSNSKSLELLHMCTYFYGFSFEPWEVLMVSLTPQDSSIKVRKHNQLRYKSLSNLQSTMSLRDLRMTFPTNFHFQNSPRYVELFVSMLVANRTLTTIQIPSFIQSEECIMMVLDALRQNRYITKIILVGEAIRRVFPQTYSAKTISALLTLMETNYWLTTMDVQGTNLEENPYRKQIEARLERNRRISSAGIFVQPTSCRVFLCGFPKAGKTSLRQKMEYILTEQQRPGVHLGYSISKRFKISWNRSPERTKGVEVVPINVGSVKLSIWDMGGQDEFHAFHDLVIPNLSDTGSASLFIVTCAIAHSKDKVKSRKDIDKELRYWLQFLSSNMRTSGNSKPHVIMIFTHVDYLPKSMKNIEEYVQGLLKSVKDLFEESFEFSSREYFVTSYSTKMVIPFVECVVEEVSTRLTKVPHIYQACVQMEEEIVKWRKSCPTKTIIKWKDFMAMYQQMKYHEVLQPEAQVALHLQDICEAVAMELNEGGHLIFFKDLKDIVIVDPNWFGTRIIGSIFSVNHECLDVHTMEPVTNGKGYASRDKLKSVLENSFSDGKESLKKRAKEVSHVDIEDVIEVMKKMNMCYEERLEGGADQKASVFIPATLRDEDGVAHEGRRQLKWNVIASSSTQPIIYIGRRLRCEDRVRTFFSRGFFPRLQVVFERKFGSNGTFSLEKNLVAFTENGMQVLVEYSGHVMCGDYLDGYIDILVQSTKDSVKSLQFVKETLIKLTRDLCSSATFGCQGVTLSESILKPACVEELWLCIDRQDQSIKEDSLIEEMFRKEEFEGYTHHWPQNPRMRNDQRGDEAQSLLGEVVWNEKVENRRFADMMHVRRVLMLPLQNASSDQDVLSIEKDEIASDITFPHYGDSELERLIFTVRDQLIEAMDKKGDEVVDRVTKHIDTKLKVMQCELVCEISKTSSRIIDHSIRSQQRQVPSYVYVTTKDLETGEWLISSLVPGLKSVQLHVMCEHKGKIHTVDGQKGIALRLESETFRAARPYVIWGLRIITMLMKVSAQGAAGLGSMVPDLEKSLLKGFANMVPNVSGDVLGQEGTPLHEVNLMGMKDLPRESETRAAHQWLVNFLKGQDLERVFGLQRVWYTDGSKEFAWLCQKHIDEGYRTGVLELCPTGTTSNVC